MSDIFVIGVSFKTVSVEVRETLARAFGAGDGQIGAQLTQRKAAIEAVTISTCNRFEIVAWSHDAEPITHYFKEVVGEKFSENSLYVFQGLKAVRHLYSVAASLDSMVVGEAQILGQLKSSYRAAVEQKTVGPYLHHAFQTAFNIAKRIRSHTGIAQHGVSVSYVAIQLAQQIFGDLRQKSVAVIGSGEMAELAVLHLASQGCSRITVINRTLERAVKLAERFGGAAQSLSELNNVLAQVDIVIGSIAGDKAIVDVPMIRSMTRTSPLFMIDLGLPRNFSPGIAEFDWVYLYNVDDLAGIAKQNQALREEARHEASIILDYGVMQFERWQAKVLVEPEIIDFRSRVKAICSEELRDVSDNQTPVFLAATDRISQKLAHEFMDVLSRVLSRDHDVDQRLAEVLGLLSSSL